MDETPGDVEAASDSVRTSRQGADSGKETTTELSENKQFS